MSLRVDAFQPGVTYQFRVVASNEKGTTFGPNRSFTTLTTAAPGTDPTPPAVDPIGPIMPVETAAQPALGSSVALAPGVGR